MSDTENTPIPAKQGEGLVPELRRIAQLVRIAADTPKAIDLHGLASDVNMVAAKIAANRNLTEQDEAPPLDEWQPIEDAPKDGKWIAILCRDEVVAGFWSRVAEGWFTYRPATGSTEQLNPDHGYPEPTHFKPIGNLPNGGSDD